MVATCSLALCQTPRSEVGRTYLHPGMVSPTPRCRMVFTHLSRTHILFRTLGRSASFPKLLTSWGLLLPRHASLARPCQGQRLLTARTCQGTDLTQNNFIVVSAPDRKASSEP